MKTSLTFLLFFIVIAVVDALPYIPGCPLHESCVRIYKQEQRQRQRERRQRESPDIPQEETDDEDGAENKPVKKPLGLIMGLQIDLGNFNNSKNDYINLRPSVAYLNDFSNFDIFAHIFYTLSLDDPGLSPVAKNEKLETLIRAGIMANIGYSFDISESLILGAEIDNQLYFDFTSDANPYVSNGNTFSYAVLEPLFRIGYDMEIGDISLSNSFPFSYVGGMALDYTVAASFNTLFGLGFTVSCQLWNLWADMVFQYGETELTVSYWHGPFFASLSVTADGSFRQFGVEPYLAYRIKQCTIFASLVLTNLGKPLTNDEMRLNKIQGRQDVTGIVPTIGAKFRF